MTTIITRGDAANLILPDETVDIIVTSPPYLGLRSYTDGGKHYVEQIGAEATPREYIDALIACTREWMRVLKPGGSIFVNLGDKYASYEGNRGHGGVISGRIDPGRNAATTGAGLTGGGFVRNKSLMLLPERYRIACVDELGLIVRAVIEWDKPNGMPESVTDRVRRSHEDWVHLTKQPRYYSAIDAIRDAYQPSSIARAAYPTIAGPEGGTNGKSDGTLRSAREPGTTNPLGKLPGSVWRIATQPLTVPQWRGVEAGQVVRYFAGREAPARAEADAWLREGGAARRSVRPMADHFAAFPMEWPRRLILGWSPAEVCTACGEGRRLVTSRARPSVDRAREQVGGESRTRRLGATSGLFSNAHPGEYPPPIIEGWVCACPDTSAPSTPGVVLDPFGGTGTTALVASVLGRVGISNDLSGDYCRLARWRTMDEKQRIRAGGAKPPPVRKPRSAPAAPDTVLSLFGGDEHTMLTAAGTYTESTVSPCTLSGAGPATQHPHQEEPTT